ncbi:MAG TPA: TIGR04211 family SH3 domain-containing protein [Steroidobacteraceae bacterium]|nr:TIGR04211 family SH3 domain-containing protein [Steroidobacteraceae bacterium]
MTAKLTARLLPAPLLLLCAVASNAVRAENLYVIEQLVVSVSSAPDGSGERVASVRSGDALEVLERSGDWVHVRTGSGREGWIRASYLSAEEPLRPRLAQRTAEVARLKEDVSRLQAQLAAASSPASATPGGGAAAPTAALTAAVAAEDAAAAPPALFAAAEEENPRRVWPWALGAGLLALCVGFALGALVLDRHIRRKYGGLRIY